MRAVWLGCSGLVGGCFFGGGSVGPSEWPERAAIATCDFSERCAAAAFYRDFGDDETCRATNELALEEEAADALADGCPFDEVMADACLDALKGSCEDAGTQSKTIFEPCQRVWNCDDGRAPVTTDSGR